MSDLDPLDPRLGDIERRLTQLSPCPREFRHAETLFRAGQASVQTAVQPSRKFWPLVTAVSWLMTVGMGAALLYRPAERIVFVERASAAEAKPAERPAEIPRLATAALNPPWTGETAGLPAGGDWGIMRARQLALRFGVEALPNRQAATGQTDPWSLRYADWHQRLQASDEINGG